MMANKLCLIETDEFPFEFLSQLAERESWRKEIHRPIYYLHKWWAKRLGSVFRGILLGCTLQQDNDLSTAFYCTHSLNMVVFDPFMGSGTTIGEAHKLGCTALGRDINPVAVNAVQVALGKMDRAEIIEAFEKLKVEVGEALRNLYRARDSQNRSCDVLYYFWVMQAPCPQCSQQVDLFSTWIIARNAYPNRNPEIQLLCPSCGRIFPSLYGKSTARCPACQYSFSPSAGTANGTEATCRHCHYSFKIIKAINGTRPRFRLYGKLVLTKEGIKEYLSATTEDLAAYQACSEKLCNEIALGNIQLPSLSLEMGYNTQQAMNYGFLRWLDFFNDRQLLALSLLHNAIKSIVDQSTRNAFLTLFSGILEFNNLFASYKGEGTGAVRHMFAHHILKPERAPIEANIWGTPKSSGSFSGLFRSRLLRALDYRLDPTEVSGIYHKHSIVCSPAFTGKVEKEWPKEIQFSKRQIYLSYGNSAETKLPDKCIDLVVTDPPFFDNVHYSELADFFYAWQQIKTDASGSSTRNPGEVQDISADKFANKLQNVFQECYRLLKEDGLLVFTYHHSRNEGWKALAHAVLGAGFIIINSHPVKSEMSIAIPKAKTNEPIQLDIILVCRKINLSSFYTPKTEKAALESAQTKIERLRRAGFKLSRNDCKIIILGQMLTTLVAAENVSQIISYVDAHIRDINDGTDRQGEMSHHKETAV